jgi:hypothetical protein
VVIVGIAGGRGHVWPRLVVSGCLIGRNKRGEERRCRCRKIHATSARARNWVKLRTGDAGESPQ